MSAVQPPTPDFPLVPDPYTFLDLVLRDDEGDPEGILRALMGDGSYTFTDWTPTQIDGLWGLVELYALLNELLRTGAMLNPLLAPPSFVDRIATRRGITDALIAAARSSGSPDIDEARVRKLGVLAPRLFAWKGTRSGGGDGGTQRALRSFLRNRVPLRENFFWRTFVGVSGTPDPDQAVLNRDLSVFRDPEDHFIHDWYCVDFPVGDIAVRDLVEELVRIATPAGETAYVHWTRWVDEFVETDGAARDWTTDLLSKDSFAIVPPTTYAVAPGVDPYNPAGEAQITTKNSTGSRWIYPANAPNTLSGLPNDHFLDVVLAAEAVSGSATRSIDVELNWNTADGAYRVTVADDGSVVLYADAAAPVTTSVGTAAGCFPAGALTADAVRLSVSIEYDSGVPDKVIRVYIDGALVITYTDNSALHNTGGAVRIGTTSKATITKIRNFKWQALAPPTVLEA